MNYQVMKGLKEVRKIKKIPSKMNWFKRKKFQVKKEKNLKRKTFEMKVNSILMNKRQVNKKIINWKKVTLKSLIKIKMARIYGKAQMINRMRNRKTIRNN